MITLLAPSRPARPEQREAPTLYADPVRLGTGISGITDEDAPTLAQQRQAYRGIIARCVLLRSNAVAAAVMAATVEREARPGEMEPVEVAHPWVRLLKVPSPSYSRRYVWHWAQQARDLGRGAFFFVERGRNGVPMYLHPVFPTFGTVNPVGGSSGEITGYVFHPQGGRHQRWAAEDVVWLRHPHPVSPYESASLLEIAAYESDTDLYAHIYRRDAMKAGGAPRLQITTDQKLTTDQTATLEDKARRKFWGDTKFIPVFGQGSHLENVGMTAKDMEYIEQAKLTRTEIMQIFGVPEGLLSDHANRANAEAARATFADLTVQPEADAVCDQLTMDFTAAFRANPEAGLTIVAPDVVPLDLDFVMRQDEIHLRTGQRVINELRERDGLDGFEGGDVPLVSAAVVPLEQVVADPADQPEPVPAALMPGNAPIPEGPNGTGDEEAEEEDDEAARRLRSPYGTAEADNRLTFRVLGRMRARGAEILDEDLDIEWRAVDAAKRRAERPMEAAMGDFIRRVGREVAEAARNRSRGVREEITSAGEIFDIGRWLDELEREMGPLVVNTLRRGFETGALRIAADLTFDPSIPESQVALARVLSAARSIPETLEAEVASVVNAGLAEGLAADELAQRIRERFDDLAPWKARQIAQTSGTAAFEAGQQVAFAEGGVNVTRWLTQRDGSVRASHDAMDGEEAPIGQAFSNGLLYPADPSGSAAEIINCRCTGLPVLSDEDEPRSWAQRRNAHLRARYQEEIAGRYGERGEIIEELREGTFEGQAYSLAWDTARKACDGNG